MQNWRAQAPTRIDLAGGTIDLWPLHQLLSRKATLNVAVTLEATVEVRPSPDRRYHFESRDQNLTFAGNFAAACQSESLKLLGYFLQAFWHADLPPISVSTAAKSPAGAGLGGSSCLAIALGGALWAARSEFEDLKPLAEDRLVATAQDVEARIIMAPTGIQDYWGAVRGGINVITYPPGHPEVETYAASALAGLEDELIVCFSGKSRASAINNWEIFRRTFDGDKHILSRLEAIGQLSADCAAAAQSGDLRKTLRLSAAEFGLRKELWPNIVTPETERMDQAALQAGASFSRVCGAGGGGVMAVFAPMENRDRVCEALAKAGGLVLNATVASHGLSVQPF